MPYNRRLRTDCQLGARVFPFPLERKTEGKRVVTLKLQKTGNVTSSNHVFSMKILISTGLVLLGGATAAFAGPHVGVGIHIGIPAPIVVHEAPPPRLVERVYTSPGSGYIWIPGHYTWTENRWVWLNGTWALPPQPGAVWVDGRWTPDTRQWIEAHWQVAAPPPAPPTPAPHVSSGSNVPVPSTPAPAASGPTEIVVEDAPPPPPHEVIGASPGRGYVWVGGYWGWLGGHREWIPGRWERPPRRHAVWVAPRWEHRGHGYAYVHGYWH